MSGTNVSSGRTACRLANCFTFSVEAFSSLTGGSYSSNGRRPFPQNCEVERVVSPFPRKCDHGIAYYDALGEGYRSMLLRDANGEGYLSRGGF